MPLRGVLVEQASRCDQRRTSVPLFAVRTARVPRQPNPGREATDDELRRADAHGYHPAQQRRSLDTTRTLVTSAWDLMADHPGRPLRAAEVLAATGVSSSSFYGRFESLHALVEYAGLVAISVEERRRAEPDRACGDAGPPEEVLGAATREVFAPALVPGRLPREVLASGAWSEPYVDAYGRCRQLLIRDLAGRVVLAMPTDATGELEPASASYPRLLTWLHLICSAAHQLWAVGGAVLPATYLSELADVAVHLGGHLFAPADVSGPERPDALDLPPPPTMRRRRVVPARSDRGERAARELRDALHRELLRQGRELSPTEVTRSVHRSRTSFFDAFGTVGSALADLARAEQIGRVPTQVLRPRSDVGPDAVVAHVIGRLRAWQDHHGITGRRLLQAAPDHPELAQEVLGQILDSVELLTGWYAPAFTLPEDHVRALFTLLIAAEQHQVVWGPQPVVVAGPRAVDALLGPVIRRPGAAG
jgi:AcrR family transcriptional regulator